MYCLTKLECFLFFFSILNLIAMIELEYWLRANNIKKIANIQISSDRPSIKYTCISKNLGTLHVAFLRIKSSSTGSFVKWFYRAS